MTLIYSPANPFTHCSKITRNCFSKNSFWPVVFLTNCNYTNWVLDQLCFRPTVLKDQLCIRPFVIRLIVFRRIVLRQIVTRQIAWYPVQVCLRHKQRNSRLALSLCSGKTSNESGRFVLRGTPKMYFQWDHGVDWPVLDAAATMRFDAGTSKISTVSIRVDPFDQVDTAVSAFVSFDCTGGGGAQAPVRRAAP